MEKQIIMKTNISKAAKGLKAAGLPKPAKGVDRLLAGFIDLVVIMTLTFLSINFFSPEKLLPLNHEIQVEVYVAAYFYILFVIIPHTLFSQTLGKTLLKIKVVSNSKYARASLVNVFIRDTLFRPLCLLLPLSLNNKEGRAVHDKMAGTVVVKAI